MDLIFILIYPYDMDTIVIWGGTLAILLNKFFKSLFKIDRVKFKEEEQYKRIGVYYMCIDDLPL